MHEEKITYDESEINDIKKYLEVITEPLATISTPILKKDGMSSYTIYNLVYKDQTYQRRFSDFYFFRQKLVECWPGIYVPNIPPKKTIGNKDNKYIRYRMLILDKFINRILHLDYFRNSEEFKLFLANNFDLEKVFKGFNSNYNQTVRKFKSAFENVPEKELEKSLSQISEFRVFLQNSASFIKIFKENVEKIADKKDKEKEEYFSFLQNLSEYEKNCLAYLTNNDFTKLVFMNFENSQIASQVPITKTLHENPYREVQEWLEDEEMDVIAVLEAISGIFNLIEKKKEIITKKNSVESDINNKNKGVKSVKNLFGTIKNDLHEMTQQKANLEQNIADIDEIIKISANQMTVRFEIFKMQKLIAYYRVIKICTEKQMSNVFAVKSLWSLIGNEKNIQNIINLSKKN